MDEDEVIVQEGDVVVHQGLSGSLHLLSYPLRSAHDEIEEAVGVRMRPTRRNIEYEYAINTRGEQFDERARGDPRLARVRLRGSEVTLKNMHMAAVMKSGTLHVTPITAMHMMRPDISHLDSGYMEAAGAGAPQQPPAASAGASSNAPVRVHMQMRRRDVDGRAEAWKRASWNWHAGQEEADPWVQLQPVKADSSRSQAVAGMLTKDTAVVVDVEGEGEGEGEGGEGSAATAEEKAVTAARFAESFLAALTFGATGSSGPGRGTELTLGGITAGAGAAAVQGSSVSTASASLLASTGGSAITLAALEKQPVAIQVEEALRRAHVLSTPRLLELSSSAASLEDALAVIRTLARLVRGNWVLRSDVYFSPPWRERLKPLTATEVAAAAAAASGAGASSAAASSMQRAASSGASAHRGPGARAGRSGPAKASPALQAARIAVRDFLLCAFVFAPDASVHVDDTAAALGLLPRALIPLLTELGTRTGPASRVWRFKRPDSTDFAARFPRWAEADLRWWKRRDTELSGSFRDKLERAAASGVALPLAQRGYPFLSAGDDGICSDGAGGGLRGTVGLAAGANTNLPVWLLAGGRGPHSEAGKGAGVSSAEAALVLGLGLGLGGGEERGAGAGGRGGGRGSTRGRGRSRASSMASEGSQEGVDLSLLDSRTVAEIKMGVQGSARSGGAKKEGVRFAAGAGAAAPSRSAAGAGAGEEGEGTGASLPSGAGVLSLAPVTRDVEGSRLRDRLSAGSYRVVSDMLKDSLRTQGVCSERHLLRRLDKERDLPAVAELYALATTIAKDAWGEAEPPLGGAPGAGRSKAEAARAAAAHAMWAADLEERTERVMATALRAVLADFAAHVPDPAIALFILRSTGSAQVDRYRPVMLHLLAGAPKKGVRKADIRDAVRAALGEDDVPVQVYPKLTKELAVSKAGSAWGLKSGEEAEEEE